MVKYAAQTRDHSSIQATLMPEYLVKSGTEEIVMAGQQQRRTCNMPAWSSVRLFMVYKEEQRLWIFSFILRLSYKYDKSNNFFKACIKKHCKMAKWCTEYISSVVEVSSCSHYFLSLFEFCHNLIFWIGSQFEVLSLVTIWFFFNIVTFWGLSHLDFLSFVIFWFIFSLVTFWNCEFCDDWSFWVLWHFNLFSFVAILVFEFCHILSFRVLSQ